MLSGRSVLIVNVCNKVLFNLKKSISWDALRSFGIIIWFRWCISRNNYQRKTLVVSLRNKNIILDRLLMLKVFGFVSSWPHVLHLLVSSGAEDSCHTSSSSSQCEACKICDIRGGEQHERSRFRIPAISGCNRRGGRWVLTSVFAPSLSWRRPAHGLIEVSCLLQRFCLISFAFFG